ncbi:hypothetical protein OBBRIDRAFT_883275 [Obba rivulosa]|uniref:Phosphatidate phosphatase APP1 catalytic domain-containing protein n=1 Tax=Obba rivulosa TaxID=1052685 RepID=A0A8E2DVE0_9APHY|nr:hypothetical protein OBBRIDRAFT_883275 [Obba rivulosa]
MSDDMPSWRSLASAASRSIKGYVSQRDLKRGNPLGRAENEDRPGLSRRQTWGQWASQKLRRANDDGSAERLALFPGWATRRYRQPMQETSEGAPFNIEVFVSGYASRSGGTGKAMLRIAKSFAALPKLSTPPGGPGGDPNPGYRRNGLSKSTEDLLSRRTLPPYPDEMSDEAEMEALKHRFDSLDVEMTDFESLASSYRSGSSSFDSATTFTTQSSASPSERSPVIPSADLHRLHANLEARLHPFWSSALASRTVRLSLYASDPSLYDSDDESRHSGESITQPHRPIVTCTVHTSADGSFQHKFSISWETMCTHSAALHIAFGDPTLEHDIFFVAELLSSPSSPSSSVSSSGQPKSPQVQRLTPTVIQTLSIPLTYSHVRLISDIDDTVKLANLVSGARTVFHNVFVKDLKDSIIPGMGDWYTNLWKCGVRFHYVSNGPFELLPVVREFFQLSQLPPGSIRLRSYAGRSLFNGLLSAPAVRKRAGVLEVLDSFPDSRFILVGDSGEQDLELYSAIAKERPEQILAIFIRDATTMPGTEPVEDATGSKALRRAPRSRATVSSSTTRYMDEPGAPPNRLQLLRSKSDTEAPPRIVPRKPVRTYSDVDAPRPTDRPSVHYTSRAPTYSPVVEDVPEGSPFSPLLEEPKELASTPSTTPIVDTDRKRQDLQARIYRARLEIPEHIPLRLFRRPEECEEAAQLLDSLQVHNRNSNSH